MPSLNSSIDLPEDHAINNFQNVLDRFPKLEEIKRADVESQINF